MHNLLTPTHIVFLFQIVGIITRHNLTLEALEEKIIEVEAKAHLLSDCENRDDYTATASTDN
jgi:hypothetical protein